MKKELALALSAIALQQTHRVLAQEVDFDTIPNQNITDSVANTQDSVEMSFTTNQLNTLIETVNLTGNTSSIQFAQSHLESLRNPALEESLPDYPIIKDIFGQLPQGSLRQVVNYFTDRDIQNNLVSTYDVDEHLVNQLSTQAGDLVIFQTPTSDYGINQESVLAISLIDVATQELVYFVPRFGNQVFSQAELIETIYPNQKWIPTEQAGGAPDILTTSVISMNQYIQTEAEVLGLLQQHLNMVRLEKSLSADVKRPTQKVIVYGAPGAWGGLGYTVEGEETQDINESIQTLEHKVGQIEAITGTKLQIQVDYTYARPSDDGQSIVYTSQFEEYARAVQAWAQRTGHQVEFSLNIKSDEHWNEATIGAVIRQMYRGQTPSVSAELLSDINPTITFDPEYQVWTRDGIATGEDGHTRIQLDPAMINRLAFLTMLERAKVAGIDDWQTIIDTFGRNSFGLYDIGEGPDGFTSHPEEILPLTQILLATLINGQDSQQIIAAKLEGLDNYNQRLEFNFAQSMMIFFSPHLSQAQSENYASLEEVVQAFNDSGIVATIILQ